MPAAAHRATARQRETESSSLTFFDGFGLNDAIARAVARENYACQTPIHIRRR